MAANVTKQEQKIGLENGNKVQSESEVKQKSVSFVNEKLIINAIKSASINEKSSNGNSSSVISQKANPTATFAKENISNTNNTNSGSGNTKRQTNNNHYYHNNKLNNIGSNYHNKHKQMALHSINTKYAKSRDESTKISNPVIIYYNNPEIEINVDELLNKCQNDKRIESEKTKVNHLNNFKSNKFNRFSGSHQQHMSNRDNINDNWRSNNNNNQNSHLRFNNSGTNYHYRKGNQNNIHKNSKNNFSKLNSNDKSESITIYYNDTSVSLEENLKRLKDKQEINKSDFNKEKSETVNFKATNGTSSQSKVIPEVTNNNNDNILEPSVAITECITNSDKSEKEIPASVHLIGSNDLEDVISGGVAIENPRLSLLNSGLVICTLVSHPGHFYVKYLNEKYEEQLKAMTTFYQNDEHIELSIDVLKSGQYFAASRNDNGSKGEWIRVKLLHAENSDAINCLLIDEGCVGVFKLNQLQPLYNRFRLVPRQAIRVSLSGVGPKETDWLPNEALEFKQLIENRKLKCKTIEMSDENFELIEPETVVEIELFFVENSDDENSENKLSGSVSEFLIEKQLAIKK